ncbi:MAG: hypothetical protein EOO77_18885 [Oxalobacteraceae bacterium]|nr:MAG: hypothetical protein EOO77_18885 [Oxalobacteraceae bacterium]
MNDLARLHRLRRMIGNLESDIERLGRDRAAAIIGMLGTFRTAAAEIEAAWPDARVLDQYGRSDGDRAEAQNVAVEVRYRKLRH